MKTIYYGTVRFADGTTGTLQIRHNNEGVVGTHPHSNWEPLPPSPYRVQGSIIIGEVSPMSIRVLNGEGDARTN